MEMDTCQDMQTLNKEVTIKDKQVEIWKANMKTEREREGERERERERERESRKTDLENICGISRN